MKVLMIAPEPVLEPRGTSVSVYHRLWGLSSLGCQVDLLTYHLGEDVNIPGVTIHRIPRLLFINDVKVGPSWTKLLLDVLVFCKAIIMLITKKYDVIHSHEEAAFLAIPLAALFGTRHLYDMHSSLPRQLENFTFCPYRPVIRLFEMLERWAIRTCDGVITISSDLQRHVKEINPTARSVVIDNLAIQSSGTMVDQRMVNELKRKLALNGRLPIVYTGTFERYQGLDLLIESAAIVRKHHSEVLFILVGGKPRQIQHLKNMARKHQVEDAILFTRAVPLDQVAAYLMVAEILISPRAEGMPVPLKLYSYLLSGNPIVATAVGGHTQLLNDDIALLVAPTSAALAKGILTLVENPNLRRQLGLEAQRVAQEKSDPAKYLAKLDQVYQSLRHRAATSGQSAHSSKD